MSQDLKHNEVRIISAQKMFAVVTEKEREGKEEEGEEYFLRLLILTANCNQLHYGAQIAFPPTSGMHCLILQPLAAGVYEN